MPGPHFSLVVEQGPTEDGRTLQPSLACPHGSSVEEVGILGSALHHPLNAGASWQL